MQKAQFDSLKKFSYNSNAQTVLYSQKKKKIVNSVKQVSRAKKTRQINQEEKIIKESKEKLHLRIQDWKCTC